MLIALAAGLTFGTVLGLLFAPENGRETKGNISDEVASEETSALKHEGSQVNDIHKKPKSDIKESIHQAHTRESHTEQSFSA